MTRLALSAALALALVLALLLGAAGPALADEAPPEPPATTEFRSAPEPAANDFEALLASCDQKLTRCEKENGVGYLGAAYIAIWVILLVFFVATRMKQARLVAEMQELRARLAKLTEERAG
ncbi:MAG: hypothetical protein H6745_29060 [Deltaproteobacteria bacterium]|nr:hypothetical protein [Deltaproteobacteria bacterium]